MIKNLKNKCPYVVAEIGVNHNGNLEIAKKSILAAAKAGADAVKFQMFNTEEFMSNSGENYKYKIKNGYKTEKMHNMFKRLEFNYSWFPILKKLCKRKKIDFFSTAGDQESADFLAKKKSKMIKIASPDLTNLPLLQHVAKKKILTIVSTGMGEIKEIDKAVKIFRDNRCPLILLHCVSMYPTQNHDSKIARILALKKRYTSLPIGYSDHTIGTQASIIATTLGAIVIEKHFTLNKRLIGPDHQISLDPKELKRFIKKVKEVKNMLGKVEIEPDKKEKLNRNLFRRSVTAKKDIKKNEKFNLNNVTLRRPETGLHPNYLSKILGKKSKRFLKADQKIKFSDIS